MNTVKRAKINYLSNFTYTASSSSSSSSQRAPSLMLPRQWPETPLASYSLTWDFPSQNNQSSCFSCDIEYNVQPVVNVWLTFFLLLFFLSLLFYLSFSSWNFSFSLLLYTWQLINISLFIRFKSPRGCQVISIALQTLLGHEIDAQTQGRFLFTLSSLSLLHLLPLFKIKKAVRQVNNKKLSYLCHQSLDDVMESITSNRLTHNVSTTIIILCKRFE